MRKVLIGCLAVFIGLLMFLSCSADASDKFHMDYQSVDIANWIGTAYLYLDSETGVEYILFENEGNIAITPRYEMNGANLRVRIKK